MRIAGVGIAAGLTVALSACSGARVEKTVLSSIGNLQSCLERHGITHAREAFLPMPQSYAVPALAGVEGLSVPRGSTRAQFVAALSECGAGDLRVAPAPVTSVLLQREISSLVSCLRDNDFQLPAPEFAGRGPVLDTKGIDVRSALWAATVRGCSVNRQLTREELAKCMTRRGLEGSAKNNPIFYERYVKLADCLQASVR